MYALVDGMTGEYIKFYPQDKFYVAKRRADKLDSKHGACRYGVRWVDADRCRAWGVMK